MLINVRPGDHRACSTRIVGRPPELNRYRSLLQTNLTELERSFVERRLAEEEAALTALVPSLIAISVLRPRQAVARGRKWPRLPQSRVRSSTWLAASAD